MRISNILSFEHKGSIDDCQEIRFDKNLNIMIGPNGAGKSNFLEIINKIFKMGIVWGCTYDRNPLEMIKKDPQNYRLTSALIRKTPVHNLSKNYFNDNNDMRIKIEVELNENDFSNLIFIQKNAVEINQLLLKYSGMTVNFNPSVSETELRSKPSMVFEIESQADNKIFTNKTGVNDEPSRFILNYFMYFEYLQNLIKIVNEYENKDWIPLKNSFALIGGYRNFNQIDPLFKLDSNESGKWEELRSKVTLDGTRESKNEEPIVFVYVKHKLAYNLNHIEHSIIQGLMNDETKNTAMDFLRKDPLFKTINDLLESNLNLTLDIDHKEKTLDYYFNFRNKSTNRLIQISDLSSGEKGIIHFIFSIYGYELKDGVIIIDEPELHLHPQIQQKYLNIIFDVIKQMNLQFIIATHSPIFVNERTIDGIRRFYLDDNGFTKVITPNVGSKEKELIQILSYTNSSKIFFSDKVVLVEGDSDEYFFRFYFDKYKETRTISKSIDFLYIGGKDKIGYWEKFLTDCKINSYYVGDLDNVSGGQSAQSVQQYPKSIFVLQQGDLETYIGKVRHYKLENAIDFCKNRYDTWKTDPDNKAKIEELDKIFDQIVI